MVPQVSDVTIVPDVATCLVYMAKIHINDTMPI